MQADALADPDNSATVESPIRIAPVVRLLWTPKEAAVALRISPRLLWSLTRDGTIPAIRLRRAVRYSPRSLQSWIDKASGTN